MNIKQYEGLLVRIAEELVLYLIRMGASKEDAQDIVQDTFVKIIETEMVLPYSKIRAWMYRVAIRTYLDIYRRKKRYQEILAVHFFHLPNWELQPEENEGLSKALTELDVDSLTILIMKYEQELKIKDISMILNVSESKVKTDLFRARKKLKAILLKEGYE